GDRSGTLWRAYRAYTSWREEDPDDRRRPRRPSAGPLRLAPAPGRSRRPRVPDGRERLHRPWAEADRGVPRDALRGDARPDQGGRHDGPPPAGRALRLHAHGEGQAAT